MHKSDGRLGSLVQRSNQITVDCEFLDLLVSIVDAWKKLAWDMCGLNNFIDVLAILPLLTNCKHIAHCNDNYVRNAWSGKWKDWGCGISWWKAEILFCFL